MARKIIRYKIPRKCPICPCCFFTSVDYEAHMETHWRPARNGNGEWLPAEAAPDLARMINLVGTLIKDGYKYVLIDNKIIYRTKSQW